MTSSIPPLSNRQKVDELWRRGILLWLLHAAQVSAYNAFKTSTARTFVLNTARRFGKTFLLCVIALEKAIQTPGADVKLVTMSQKATRKIVEPLFREILKTCPKDIRPKYFVHDGLFRFNNGSLIHCCGTEMGQIDNLRGQACDLALVDEAGFVSELEYVVDSVLMPQFVGRPGARLIMASTPPVAPDHPFVSRYMKDAINDNAYLHRTIYDNPRLTEADIEEAKKAAGGEGTIAWRREYLAEIVTERDSAVFPEATPDVMTEMIGTVERPPFFLPIVVLDLGYLDNTGMLFGYYHFTRNKIVIEDEILVNKRNSAELVAMARAKEKELWGDHGRISRIVEANAMTVADINEIHKFNCRAPDKADFVANVNRLRMDIAARMFIFSPKCVQTVQQVMFSTWDRNRKTFARTANRGHYDLAAAMIYLSKHVDRSTNPIPPGYGLNPFTTFNVPTKHHNALSERVKSMFARRHNTQR